MATFFRKDGWVKSVIGPAVPGAQVYVCLQPANIDALPPSPLANIFSDVNGLVPITQPIITDGFGHYDYYIAAGLYTEVIGLNNVLQQVYPDQDFGLGVPGPGNPYVAGANITIVGNVISAVIPPSSGVELQTNGVDNTLQTKLNLKQGAGILLSADGAGGVTIAGTVASASTLRFAVPTFTAATTFFESPASGPINMVAGGLGAPTNTLVTPTVSAPGYTKGANSGVASHNAYYITGDGGKRLVHGYAKSIKISAAVFGITSVRYWICPVSEVTNTDAGLGNLEFDAPLFVLAGFRFSTAALDTHWMAICNAASGAQTVVDTGITPDITGALHVFETRIAQGVPGTINFFIDNVAVGSITSANVPVASTAYGVLAYAEDLAAVPTAIGWNATVAEYFQ